VRCFFGGIDGILSRLGVVSTIAVTQAELDGNKNVIFEDMHSISSNKTLHYDVEF
jgi:hypothetical protein